MGKHWHLQMNRPEGRDGDIIETTDMLKENPPVIGIGEWDDQQCSDFKQNLHKGNVRLGSLRLQKKNICLNKYTKTYKNRGHNL